MEKSINAIVDFLISSHNLDISRYNNSFLEKSIERRMVDNHCLSTGEYLHTLENNLQETNQLIESLHVAYSVFFRNPLTFSYLELIVFPLLAASKQKFKDSELRIWSAACAAGQEPYSIAILLDEMKTNRTLKFKYRIFATDNNHQELSKAQLGTYNLISVENTTLKRIRNYFMQKDESFQVVPTLKKQIDFSYFDLLSDQSSCPAPSIYGNFDLVFCSNLLFYYKPESQVRMLEKIANTMAPGGYLITGETERDILIKNNFYEIFENSAIFQKMPTKV